MKSLKTSSSILSRKKKTLTFYNNFCSKCEIVQDIQPYGFLIIMLKLEFTDLYKT